MRTNGESTGSQEYRQRRSSIKQTYIRVLELDFSTKMDAVQSGGSRSLRKQKVKSLA